jgi:hypothetical protein
MYTMHDGGGSLTADDISIEQQRVNDIVSTLDDAMERVHKGAGLGRVPAQSLGDAATATELELHAGKAHGRIVEEMERTVAGLTSYRRALDRFVADAAEQDAEQARRLAAIEQGITCVAQPTFQDNSQCTLPTEGDR